jgi:hypothetical protein
MTKNNPKVAYSNKQLAERFGWPEWFPRLLKKSGCIGYEHGRWNVEKTIAWLPHLIESRKDEVGIDWSRELKREQTLRERLKRQTEEKAVIPASEVRADAAAAMGFIFSELERLSFELPAICKGCDEMTIHKSVKVQIAKFRTALKEKFNPLNPELKTQNENPQTK